MQVCHLEWIFRKHVNCKFEILLILFSYDQTGMEKYMFALFVQTLHSMYELSYIKLTPWYSIIQV
jgi:hypothetical protein